MKVKSECMKVKSESEVLQSCPTPSDLMDCSLPGSSIHGILQARVLEWSAIAFSRNHSLIVIKHVLSRFSLFTVVIKKKKKVFSSFLSCCEEITVQVYALRKINKNRKPYTVEIDSFVTSTIAIALN